MTMDPSRSKNDCGWHHGVEMEASAMLLQALIRNTEEREARGIGMLTK